MKFETTELRYKRVPAKAPLQRGRAAVWQARLVLLVMINLAQLWILSATVDAALAHEFRHLLPLVIASGICWLISLSIFVWWRPAGSRQSGSA
jgi:hypothetical protein